MSASEMTSGLRIKFRGRQAMLPVEMMARRTDLSVNANGNRRVPNLHLNSDGSVNRDWNNWDGDWNSDNCLVLLCNSLVSPATNWREFFLADFSSIRRASCPHRPKGE